MLAKKVGKGRLLEKIWLRLKRVVKMAIKYAGVSFQLKNIF